MHKKKILLFIKLPPPITGATLMNTYVAESKIISQNFITKLIATSYKQKIEDVRILSFRKMHTFFNLHFRLLQNLVRFKPDFVYIQISPLGLAFFRDCTFIIVIKLLRIHIVYHLHGKGIKTVAERNLLQRRIYKWAFKNSSIICLSDNLTYDIESVYAGKPYIVNNGIPLAQQQSKSNKPLLKSKINILFLSNLIVSKGIMVFLNAISELSNESKDILSISIVGKEAEISAFTLVNEIKQRNLQHFVQYLGPKYDQEKETILRNMDILVYPTLNDAWPLVILEAMQFGLPVIASKEGAITEILDDGVTGLLVDKNNSSQITRALEILINNPELRLRMSEFGQNEFFEKYTLTHFENNLMEVFSSILKKI